MYVISLTRVADGTFYTAPDGYTQICIIMFQISEEKDNGKPRKELEERETTILNSQKEFEQSGFINERTYLNKMSEYLMSGEIQVYLSQLVQDEDNENVIEQEPLNEVQNEINNQETLSQNITNDTSVEVSRYGRVLRPRPNGSN
uniref:Uncharacterized protein n=1 Tax=Rhabditophanes sp. KR3021 TaxID=114890 RepID=A0AC35U8X1_9BILA